VFAQHFDKQALNAWSATFHLEFSAPSSQQNPGKTFFCSCTTFPTLGGLPLGFLLVSSRFVWCGLSNDITNWARPCLLCQQSKIHRDTRLLPQPIPVPQWQFAHLHINLVGSLQYSNGCNHIFTTIDHTSKWMESIPLSEASKWRSFVCLSREPTRLIVNYWLHMQQSGIFAIFVKIVLFNCGQTTNCS
jgi:hypothetical protein